MRRTTQATYIQTKKISLMASMQSPTKKHLTMQLPKNHLDNQSITFFEV